MKIFMVLLAAMLISGCALIAPFQDKVADKAADAIVEYCANSDANFRAKFRADVNMLVPEGHGAEITCPE